ncbi:MAG: rhodanese-like domain-containing protein [Nevskiaceae bacterium]|jgi:rhodanese-related sulfurtransferase|nr:rhodanese-like domain-containing protein [Nevskiaceae bacterium]
MDRLLEYIQLHPFLASLAGAMALAVLAFELKTRGQNYSAVQPQEAIALMNQGAQVYDLRDKDAYAAGHVGGAKHLDPSQIGNAAESLKRLKERTLLLVCEDGNAATKLTRQLHAGGFTKVFNLRGGLAAWRAEGLPLRRG